MDELGQPVLDAEGRPLYAGFMNGTIGVVRDATEGGALLEFDDGALDVVRTADLEKLTYGWAISVHKSQGSAFRRVIVPITRNRLMDRAMLYTAITRAVETVVLVGDPHVLRAAVADEPKVYRRLTKLSFASRSVSVWSPRPC